MPVMVTDHRKLPRRRGEALNVAIYQATLAELAEVGYARLTMERVAERAKASKASLYRRWPTRIELVMDAVYHVLPDALSVPDTGSLRGDILAALRRTAEALAGPAGEAMRGLLSEALGDESRAATFRENSQGTGRRLMREIVRRAVERGEVAPEDVTPRRLDAGQALLRQHFLFQGLPIPDELLVQIADEVMVPLFTRA
ncbi:TetR/AcrR family transcriptional regulator [Nonomuraea sp. NPDC052129]|uniref:TetR/AcrR family transcriptional regulator n=1 Tax=Nonomuraea TaxID=83681 RepID=UPI001CD92CC7|nr:TetR/AcrR family transcriptional regulator [Nonomuraea aurantiaca]MCA2221679.1 TetR/AcrR family transcriptional regulator [Nonomuraea aurantiaca]